MERQRRIGVGTAAYFLLFVRRTKVLAYEATCRTAAPDRGPLGFLPPP